MDRIKELLESRLTLHESMTQMVQDAGDDGLTKEKRAEWDRMDVDFSKSSDELKLLQSAEERAKLIAADPQNPINTPASGPAPEQRDARLADPLNRAYEAPEMRRLGARIYRTFMGMPGGVNGAEMRDMIQAGGEIDVTRLSGGVTIPLMRRAFRSLAEAAKHVERIDEDIRAYESYGGKDMSVRSLAEFRAETDPQDSSDNTEGGSFIAREFVGRLEQALLSFGGMRQARTTVMRTRTGANLDFPQADDTDQKGVLLGESGDGSTVQKVDTSLTTLGAFKYSSKVVKVPIELMQDSAFNFATFVGERLGERLARIMNDHQTTGTGSSQPNGAVTASAAGKTFINGASYTYPDLVDLQHSVDSAYRVNAEWMFADGGLQRLRQVLDGDNRPIFAPTANSAGPDLILGHPFVINQSMAAPDGAVKSILFGDFSKYVIRDVMDITLFRMSERYIEAGQIAFIAFFRMDSDLINAGTNPLKHGLHPTA